MRAFDFAAYTKNPATIAPAVSLVAKVWLDGDTYVVIPDPENELSAFRFAKGDVHVVDVLPPEPGAAAIAEPLYEIAVRHNAPCIKLSVGAVEQYWNALSEPQAALAATQRVRISFSANGEGTLAYNNLNRPCLGRTNLAYVRDLTVNLADKYRRRFSNEFQVWMDYAVLIDGTRGIYIHEGPATIATNGGESAGCIHLAAPHAAEFFHWITGRTRIEIDYPW
jgi:hypothetical protein